MGIIFLFIGAFILLVTNIKYCLLSIKSIHFLQFIQLLEFMKSTMKEPKLTPCEYEEIASIQFSVFSQEQIQSYSALEIVDDQFYENDQPTKGGLFDERLGISGPNQRCHTCGESVQCPGHFGHIKLSEPVMHYGFLDTIVQILKCICHRCFRLKRGSNKEAKQKMKQIKRVIDPQRRLSLMVKLLAHTKKCNFLYQQDLFDKNYKPCGATGPCSIFTKNYKIAYIDSFKGTHILSRREIVKLLQGISQYESQCQVMGFVKTKPIDLIINNLLIPPPQVRPYVLINGQRKCQDDISFAYQKIFRLNSQIQRNVMTATERNQKIDLIQRTIASIMVKLRLKTDQNNKKLKKRQANKKIKSISERLEGKQGRFRQNLLGKRVDFAARTVITPDPNLQINEVGVPQKIAKNLTIPQRVTITNYDQIVDLCLQKKVKYLINPPELNLRNQQVAINVSKLQALTRQEMSSYVNIGMTAQRVLKNGDYALLNRQPTLHRMSMMAHKVRILPQNAFRINPCVCMPYNADFDGDEMNLHIPQSYQSLSELKNISVVENQIVGPKNGTTSLGFSQDSLLGVCLITSRDTFLCRQDMMNLLAKIDSQDILQLPIPAIMKPQPLWTGKQLISIIIPKQIEIKHYKNAIKQSNFSNLQQKSLIIKKGELVSGFLQKQFIGSSSSLNNIIHYVWMEIGPLAAEKLINNLQKIANNWLLLTGFSLGVSDLIPKKQILQKKKQQEQQLSKLFYNTLHQFRSEKQINKYHLHQQGRKIMDSFEYNVNLQLNNRLSKIQDIIKNVQNYQKNNIYKIVQIKSKGSQTNLAQIFYSVGNQNINGQRCPLGFNGRSLPHFCRDDSSPIARGYVVSSFYQGLKPHQLFFHSMGGRQGLSDTAVKTSHVGYIQRKIIKSLQDLIVKYDSSVRDSKNNLLQRFYGQDGFCSEFIQRHRCIGAQSTRQRFRQIYKWKEDQLKKIYRYSPHQIKTIKRQYTKIYRSRKTFRQIFCKNVQSPTYDYYCPINIQKIMQKIQTISEIDPQNKENEQKAQPLQICQKVQKLIQQCYLPALKALKQSRPIQINSQDNDKDDYESFSDQFQRQDQSQFKNYNKKVDKVYSEQFQIFKIHLRFSLSSKVLVKGRGITKASFNELLSQIKEKYFKSLAPAGQAVGCLAAQSIGEPTTQMTLNTFHLAGISDKNVTLGLPRLQQLLHCAKQMKNQSIIIFPDRPILQTQSVKPQNQTYLLDMLLYHLPERKVGDFIISSHYVFNPRQGNFLQQLEKGIQNQNKRTACKIVFVFGYSKIVSRKIWNQILQNIERSSEKSYTIDIMVQFNDISSKAQNPKISIRYLSLSNKSTQSKNKKQQKLLSTLQNLQNHIKQIRICGIKGIRTVQLSKKSLCLDQKIGVKQYSVLQAYGQGGFKQCLQHMMVNGLKTYSNSIQEIYKVLGIQAARQAIINQLKQVLKPYGISINYRHLSVLADWMCCKGTLTPVNRNGLHKLKNVSTLTKASYEMASKILFKAASFSTKDDLKQTTSHIIFGQSTQCGTSQCKLLIDPENVVKYSYKPERNVKDLQTDSDIQIIEKTPYYDESITYDNSVFQGRRNMISSPNLYHSRSPGFHAGLSPNVLSFSPTYSTISQMNSHAQSISPRYGNLGNRPNYNSLSPMGGYARSALSYSPTANGMSSTYRNRQTSGTSVLNNKLSSVGEITGKKQQQQQQFSDNEETQRTQLQQQKQQDQF